MHQDFLGSLAACLKKSRITAGFFSCKAAPGVTQYCHRKRTSPVWE
ncbi:hypothetical protein GWL_39620 [Herbaspirillum sp. GW103]|nr:hypothetical protein GWL_39620 [Herbaspirillum sp. GW103]